jgi:hypothetical protein
MPMVQGGSRVWKEFKKRGSYEKACGVDEAGR